MKQQVNITIDLTLWIDARKDRDGIAELARKSIQRGFGERFTSMKIIDLKEEAEVYGNDSPRPQSGVDHPPSPAPWTYAYNPYTAQRGNAAAEELPAFEVFDAEQNKVFDTNEDMPCEVQEANARLAKAAPALLAALSFALEFLEANDDGEEDVSSRITAAEAAIAEAVAA